MTALNKWFTENKFPTKDPKEMGFFIERKYTFLCIRVKAGGESKTKFGKSATLSPLRISFASKKPFFPLKFSSHGGSFPLSLYLFTSKPIDWVASGKTMKQLGKYTTENVADHPLSNYEVKNSKLKGQLSSLFRKIKSKNKTFRSVKLFFVNHINTYIPNNKNNSISKWEQDIEFTLNDDPHREKVRALIRKALTKPAQAATSEKKILRMGAKAKATLTEIKVTSAHSGARDLARKLLEKLKP